MTQIPTTMPATVSVVVAAGTGSRFGSELPKQFCPMAGRPVLMHTIEALRRALPDGEMLLVVSREKELFWLDLCEMYGFDSPRIVYGGATRWESVRNAVMALSAVPPQTIVAVHDGARPLLPAEVVREAVEAVGAGAAGAIPAVAVTDSLRVDTPSGATEAVDRSLYHSVQTPQVFRLETLRRAYSAPFSGSFTDDASVVEAAGEKVVLTPGSWRNIKITNPADIAVAETIFGLP
ncbi:MAG: 2-C-methyl-D-erythritol 4-phosphate cytidylyltransferase [Clostridium sp.]|nr:2-C-methyl-D-erythritol 4-phosphate cytidylyltransferase [Clostridium sp.]